MLGFNNPNAMRMLNSLYAAHAPAPAPAPAPAAPRRRRAPSPSVASESSDSESDYDSDSSSSYESYDDVDVIYKKVVEEAACPYVSPAGLRDQKTKKAAVKHLQAKGCPEVPKLKKAKAELPPSPKAPGPRKAKGGAQAAAKPDTKPEAALPVQHSDSSSAAGGGGHRRTAAGSEPVVLAKPSDAAIPKAAAKAKRAPSAYNKFVGEKLREGLSMKQIGEAWKAHKGS
jgi:hypothetical protein